MRNIYVFGSLNMDLVIHSTRMPESGETISGSDFMTNAGGKGANQAVACAKLGGNVHMAGCVGDDAFGRDMLENLKGCGVDVAAVRVVESCSSGIAVITVISGDNRIILNAGANARVSTDDVDALLRDAQPGSIFLTQLENPIEVVSYALKKAKETGCFTMLNPAPMNRDIIPSLPYVDLITPNETEFELLLSSCTSLSEGARLLREMGAKTCVVTLGSKGYCYISETDVISEDCIKAPVVDTTGAGDTFCGALAVALSGDEPIDKALRFANAAASISVQRSGAQQAIPYKEELVKIKL